MPTGFSYKDERGRQHDAYFRIDKMLVGALIAIILAILTQTGAFIWWASHISTSVSEQERRITGIESWRDTSTRQNESIIRVTTEVVDLRRQIEKLEVQMQAHAAADAKLR